MNTFKTTRCNGYTQYEDIPYGHHPRHKVDLFVPQQRRSEQGIILYIHGGGWIEGDKSCHRRDALHWCKEGYIAAAMNYRFADENIHIPDITEDITAALQAVKTVCEVLKIPVTKVMLAGGSAGGHLALHYTVTRREEAPLTPVALAAYCTPVDFTAPDFLIGRENQFEDWKYDVMGKCIGKPLTKATYQNSENQQLLRQHSPLFHLSPLTPPTVIGHGREDDVVPYTQAETLSSVLAQYGVVHDFVTYEHSGHALDKDLDATLAMAKLFKDYAERYLG